MVINNEVIRQNVFSRARVLVIGVGNDPNKLPFQCHYNCVIKRISLQVYLVNSTERIEFTANHSSFV